MTVNIFADKDISPALSECIGNLKITAAPDVRFKFFPAGIEDITKNLITISEQYNDKNKVIYFVLDLRKTVRKFDFAAAARFLSEKNLRYEVFIILDESADNLTGEYKSFVKKALSQIKNKIKYLLSNAASDGTEVSFENIIETVAQYILIRNCYNIFNLNDFWENASFSRGNLNDFFIALGRKEFCISKERIKKTIIRQLLSIEFDYHENPENEANIDVLKKEHIESNIEDLVRNLNSLCINRDKQQNSLTLPQLKKIYGDSITGKYCAIDDYFDYNIKLKVKEPDLNERLNGKDFRAVDKYLNALSNKLERLKEQAPLKNDDPVVRKTGLLEYRKNFRVRNSTGQAAVKYLRDIYTDHIEGKKRELIREIENRTKELINEHTELKKAVKIKINELSLQLSHKRNALLDTNTEKYADKTKQYIVNHEEKYFNIFTCHNFSSIYQKCELLSEEIMRECVNNEIYEEIKERVKEKTDIDNMFSRLAEDLYFFAAFPMSDFTKLSIFITGDWGGFLNIGNQRDAVKLSPLDDRFWLLFIGAPVSVKDIAGNRYGF